MNNLVRARIAAVLVIGSLYLMGFDPAELATIIKIALAVAG